MSDLLIHSMAEFSSLILPTLERAGVSRIAEIGSEFGGMSRVLADYCREQDGHLTCIDPEPHRDFAAWAANEPRISHIARPSLEVIGEEAVATETVVAETVPAEAVHAQAWFIDGDHNYYTVFNELTAIDALQNEQDQPLLVFLHDVSWPCARRDMYYAPDRIPPEYLKPHSYDHGVVLGQNDAIHGRGLRGMGNFAFALEQGGPRNGVLTAVEDFLRDADTDERPLYFVNVPAVLGLGVIFAANADWSDEVAQFLLPFHANPLMARLEENRLRNYLAVIDWQDRAAACG